MTYTVGLGNMIATIAPDARNEFARIELKSPGLYASLLLSPAEMMRLSEGLANTSVRMRAAGHRAAEAPTHAV